MAARPAPRRAQREPRLCHECREPLTYARPAAQSVALGARRAGTLRIEIYGVRCVVCAGIGAPAAPRPAPSGALLALLKLAEQDGERGALAQQAIEKLLRRDERANRVREAAKWRSMPDAVRCTDCRHAPAPRGCYGNTQCPAGQRYTNAHWRKCSHFTPK